MIAVSIAGVASLDNLAGGVTIGVAYLAVDGAASLADAGVASLVDLAEGVTGAVAGVATSSVAMEWVIKYHLALLLPSI